MNDSAMIDLSESTAFNKGSHRECYIHPDNKNLCIKVVFDTEHRKRAASREKKYYHHLQKRDISWNMVPKCYGEVDTSKGLGVVFDLITDHDGQVSKTLTYYFESGELTGEGIKKLIDLMAQLKQYLLEQRIFGRFAPRNIVCQKDESGISKLVVVDNLGNTEFIPVSNYFGFLKRQRINREWDRFIGRAKNEFVSNTQLVELLK